MSSPSTPPKSVLITGANGYIGQAVALAFAQAGYKTFGLVRTPKSAATLESHPSITPLIGSAASPETVLSALRTHGTPNLDVIASMTEDLNDYIPHFNDTISLLRLLARASNENGVRPLVLFTSGCKDYGRGKLSGELGLEPHTEESEMRPPGLLAARAEHAPKVFEHGDLFDAMVVRPTHVHGGSSSYLGRFFDLAEKAKVGDGKLVFKTDPRTILHSLNVDDCGEAYVALAEHGNRGEVKGECFNVCPGREYETIGDIGKALVRVYGIRGGVEFDPPPRYPDGLDRDDGSFAVDPLMTFSQWVGSEKIRKLTGWTERQPMFASGVDRYKREFEEAVRAQDENVAKIRGRDFTTVQEEPGNLSIRD